MKSIYAVVGLVLGDCAEDNISIGVGKRYSIKQYRLVDITDGSIIDVDKSDYESLLGSNKIYFEDTDLLSFTHVDIDMLLGLQPEAYAEVHGKMISMHKMHLTPGYNFCYSFVIDGKTVCKDSNRYMLLGVQKLDYEITMRLVYDHKNGSIFINICGLGIEPFNIGYCSSYPIDDLNLMGKMNSLVNNVRCENLDSLLDSLQILSNGCVYMNDICILTGLSYGDIIILNETKTLVVGDINRKVDSRLNSLVVPPSVENVIYSKFSLGRYGSNTKLYLSNKLSSDTIDKICDAVLGLDANKLDDAIELDNNVEFY
jgi:hypothetical protein